MDEEGRLQVQSIFATIQGEGPLAGRPAVFVRLAGCNLRCWFCDTDFESKIDNVMEAKRVVEDVRSAIDVLGESAINLVVITGGEPFRQNIIPLIDQLTREDFRVQIETAGTLWVDGIDEYIRNDDLTIVCSPKTPQLHDMIEAWCRDYKYIVSAAEPRASHDGLPLALTQTKGPRQSFQGIEVNAAIKPIARPHPDSGSQVWLQPCDEGSEVLNARNRELCVKLAMKHGYRISLQTHKILNIE